MGITKNAIRGLVIVVTAPAGAAGIASIPDTTMYKGYWLSGSNQRYVSGPLQPGWPIAFLKTDGPGMWLGAEVCATGEDFDIGYLDDKDPPLVYEKVAVVEPDTYFCLTWKSNGKNSVDTFRGTLAWD